MLTLIFFFSVSILVIFTFIDCPIESNSEGLLILLQDISVICKQEHQLHLNQQILPNQLRFFTTP